MSTETPEPIGSVALFEFLLSAEPKTSTNLLKEKRKGGPPVRIYFLTANFSYLSQRILIFKAGFLDICAECHRLFILDVITSGKIFLVGIAQVVNEKSSPPQVREPCSSFP